MALLTDADIQSLRASPKGWAAILADREERTRLLREVLPFIRHLVGCKAFVGIPRIIRIELCSCGANVLLAEIRGAVRHDSP